VQRRQRGIVEGRQSGTEPLSLVGSQRGIGDGSVELLPDPVAELGCGVLREGDGGEVGDPVGERAGRDEAEDAVDERLGLAGPGSCFDEQVGRQVGGDAGAGLGVDESHGAVTGSVTAR